MKNVVLVFLVFFVSIGVSFGQSLKGMSLNGVTGLIAIPSGRIGWEQSAEVGVDLGYHALVTDNQTSHLPKLSVSLFRRVEVAVAYDIQETENDESDILINGKIQLPTNGTAVALGGNFQSIDFGADNSGSVSQLYLAATYPGEFFSMPAETSIVVGKSFGDYVGDSDIDFGMGFDLLLFPETFQGYIHWINDFSNFSYSVDPIGALANTRGVFNSGIRIDLASNPNLSRYKFVIDATLTDALDQNRAFARGFAFGAPIR